jgi:hypothetical protein
MNALMGEVKIWSPNDGPLTFEAIKARHVPAEWHRVSQYRYPAGTRFSGTMRSAHCYVLSGRCIYRFSKETVLEPGTWTVLEEGDYELEVVGEQDLSIVLVWKLPFAIDSGGEI